MPITKERFDSGLTYDEYKAQMTRNQESLLENEQALVLDAADRAWFTDLQHPIHVLVLTEDWCGDAIATLPVLAGLAAESDRLDVRIFLRDQNLDIMDQYLKEGKYRSIPVFVFFDQAFNELGYLIERPSRVSEQLSILRDDLFSNDPDFANVAPDTDFGALPDVARDRLMEAIGAFRRDQRSFCNNELVREVREMLDTATR